MTPYFLFDCGVSFSSMLSETKFSTWAEKSHFWERKWLQTECVPSQVHMLNANPQCDSIRRWGFWEVVRSWGCNSFEWNLYHYKRGLGKLPCRFCQVRAQEEGGHLGARKQDLTRHWICCQYLDVGSPSLHHVSNMHTFLLSISQQVSGILLQQLEQRLDFKPVSWLRCDLGTAFSQLLKRGWLDYWFSSRMVDGCQNYQGGASPLFLERNQKGKQLYW